MATYDEATDATMQMVQEVIEANHSDIYTYNVKVGVIMVHAPLDNEGVRKGPALKQFKVGTPSITQVVKLKDRLKNTQDVEILLDYEIWNSSSEQRKQAILDQALYRVSLVMKDDEIVLDDMDRPKLKLRDYDYVYFGYTDVALRQGANSLEFADLQQMKAKTT